MVAIRELGPFDAIYGFSQGAAVAAFCSLLFSDDELKEAVISYSKDPDSSSSGRYSLRNSLLGKSDSLKSSSQRSLSLRFEQRKVASSFRSSLKTSFKVARDGSLSHSLHEGIKPFDYMILACPVADPSAIRQALGLHENVRKFSITTPSMILIGVEDSQKMKSEVFSRIFLDIQVKYMVGGHDVPRMVSSDKALVRTIRQNLKERKNRVEMQSPTMKKVSNISSLGLLSSIQVAHVELEDSEMLDTLVGALSNTDRNKPLLYNARDSDASHFTSYGDVLDFIHGGDGDLRRLGVKQGDVVVYGSPPGGGTYVHVFIRFKFKQLFLADILKVLYLLIFTAAVSALAFLSIMAQTTAAPLAPNTSESDAYYFLEQCNAKHLILFEGVDNPGLDAAFEKYAATGKAILHSAMIGSDDKKPGLFKYTHSGGQRLDATWLPSSHSSMDVFKSLNNPPDGVALLLGTSGTTSKPKGVPIRHSSIVRNGFILASSLGLRKDDICYSIMPLFHIGGISASILCSIAAGSSVCCDDTSFSPENMIDALAISNPQPTWYSSVPTIHNATVNYIKEMAGVSQKLRSYGIKDTGIWKEGHSLRMIRSGAAELLSRDAISLSSTYGEIPIIPTYSMSEQMPISQPPVGKVDMVFDKPGSVGVPVATSLAIVNSTTLQPLPYGLEGEIAISGPTVMDAYLNNKDADRKAFFELTLPLDTTSKAVRNRFFLTGDTGIIDKDGFLSLRGRNKEMIKKGGEQISPFEIEEALLEHPWVRKTVCFSVPSTLYGEEAGAAVILSPDAPSDVTQNDIAKEMRIFLQKRDINPLKWPTHWKVTEDDDLPKTKTNKYIRLGKYYENSCE
jgi:acyl-CoA synthetase (AMP-forming)/AMP-acid ligase II